MTSARGAATTTPRWHPAPRVSARGSALAALACGRRTWGSAEQWEERRDVEDSFRGEDGRSLPSRTALTQVTETLWKEYEEFATRDLSELRPLYLFLDGIAEKLRVGAPREAILAAWAITWDGAQVLLHVAPGTKESTECCRGFLEDMKRGGLADPVLVATDGAPGLIRAVEECFPTALRQRCLPHMRDILAKLPEEAIDEFRQAATAAHQAPSPAMARDLREDLVARLPRSTRVRSRASRRTSRRASPSSTALRSIDTWFGRPMSSNGCFGKSAGESMRLGRCSGRGLR